MAYAVIHTGKKCVEVAWSEEERSFLWRSELQDNGAARGAVTAILRDERALLNWMRDTQSFGIFIVEGLADSNDAGMDVARSIVFFTQTNFSVEFEVESKPNPNNVAYTAIALPLHTDLTNQEVPPGYQFLHCLANGAEGGESIFCDGFAVAEDLRKINPEAFDLLSSVSIPFRFHDDIRSLKTVINLDESEQIKEICFNTHLAGIFDLGADILELYYFAYQAYRRLTQKESYQVKLKLKPGEMAVFLIIVEYCMPYGF